ncbi:sericin 1-like [Macrobrachium rosenbergii]|uniref:sericin 1-like n=1 Tax=Macrobrachium rosenbergii TaxID=79674 RepID=UPI0034D43635
MDLETGYSRKLHNFPLVLWRGSSNFETPRFVSFDLPLSPKTPQSSPSTPAATRQSSSGARFSSSSTPTAAGSTSSSSSVVALKSASGTFSSSQSGASSSHTSSNNDGSYSFSFDAGDHSRSESADANLNVQGQFSFVADDGVRRRVDYQAGADRGFTASGDHLPTVPSSNTPASSQSSAFHGTSRPSTYRAPSPSLHGSAGSSISAGSQTYSSGTRPSSSTRPRFEEANTRSELRPDGSYAFAYETSSHSRNEAGDTSNNVDGDFAFVADDGQRRQIQYQAGSDTGFIAEGSHIPVGPIVPGAPSGQPTGRITPVQEVPFIDPLANSNADASYNFAFDSEQYSRSETADADGNVSGTYTVVDDDGTRRTVRFRAGQGIGFEPQEVSSSRGPRPSSSSSSPSHTGSVGSPSSSSAGAFPASTSSQVAPFSSSSPSGSTRPSSPSQYSAPSSQRHSPQNFKLTQYDASKNPNKFGYVLTFN